MLKCLYILAFVPSLVWAQGNRAEDYVRSISLENSWYVYDEDKANFVPYIPTLHSSASAHTLILDKDKYGKYDLVCEVMGQEHFIFIDGSLERKITEDEFFIQNVAELGKPSRRWVEVSIYGSNTLMRKSAFLGYRKSLTSSIISSNKQELYTMKRRSRPTSKNMTVFSFLIVLLGGVILSSTYPRAFKNFLDFSGMFKAKMREASVFINKPFGRTNISFLGLLCLVTAFICWQVYAMGYANIVNPDYLFNASQFMASGLNFVVFLMASSALYFSKVLYMRTVGSIFGLGKLVDLHFFKLLQVSVSILLPVSFIILGYYLSGLAMVYGNIEKYFSIGVFVFYLFRMLVMLFTLNKNSTIQFLYIITYLCIVELLPLVLGMRFLL